MYNFLRFSWRDKRLVLQAIGMLFYVRIGLHLFGYQRLRNHLAGRIAPSKVSITDTIHLGKLVNAVGFRLGANCLQRSLALWWMLRLYGIESNLHFGIPRQSSHAFVAHAWLQVGTMIINDKTDIRDYYTELTHISNILEQERYNFR